MEKQDKFGYEIIIKEALPNALIEFVDNFDDVNFGWEICPMPGVLLEVRVQSGAETHIKIIRYTIVTHESSVIRHGIFRGELPENLDGPDLDFFKKLIKNWQKIGH